MSTLITTITLSNIYPKDRTYTNRYDMALEIYQDSQSGTGSSGRTNYTAYLKGKASAGSGYENWRGFVTASIKVNGSAITSFDVPTIKGNSYVLLGSKSFTIPHGAGSGTASFTIGASSTTSSDSAGYMIGAWEMTAESITPPSLPDTYTVAYNSGIATSGSAPSSQTKIYGTNLTLRTNTGSLAKSNDTSTITTTFNGNGGSSDTKSSTKTTSYSFANWNTSSNGSGTDYASGGTYTSNSGVTLYPKFSSSTSYGSITTPSSSRTGYTFNGWYNSTSGGTKYADGGVSKTPTSSQTYYAQWTVVTYTVTVHHRVYGSTTDFATSSGSRTYDSSYTPSYTTRTGYHSYDRTVISANTTGTDCYCYYKPNTYTVKYNGNGSTSGSTSDTSMTYDTSSNLNSNGFARAYTLQYNADGGTTPSNTTATYSFSKWNTNSGGTGTDYNAGASVSNLTTTNNGTFNLYAKWTSASVTLPTSTKAGYTFSGWYNGSTLIGQSGATYTPTSSFTAKASWSGIPYTIVFNNNTGSGSMANQSVVYGQYVTLNANEFTKSGSSFYGWNTQADGSGTSYKDKTSVSNLIVPTSSSDTVTLYAQWESIIPISLHADSTNNVADGVAIGKKSEGGNKFEIGFDTEIGNSTTNFHLKLNGQDIGSGGGGNIDDVQVNGTSVVSNRVANVTSIPPSIVTTNSLYHETSPTVVATWKGNNSANGLAWANTSELTAGKASNDIAGNELVGEMQFSKTGTSTGYIVCTLNRAGEWMYSFTLRLYQGYIATDILISGYNYGSNHWYSPSAVILGSSTTNAHRVYFGYTGNYNLWVAVAGDYYTGARIMGLNNGYIQYQKQGAITITNPSSLPGTTQTYVDVYRPYYRNDTVSNATTSASCSGNSASATYAEKIYPTGSSATQYLVGVNTYSTSVQRPYIYSPCYMKGGYLYSNSTKVVTGVSKGSSTQPVYINSDGVATACTAYSSASVNYASSAGSAPLGSNFVTVYSGSTTGSISVSSSTYKFLVVCGKIGNNSGTSCTVLTPLNINCIISDEVNYAVLKWSGSALTQSTGSKAFTFTYVYGVK